MLLAAGEKVPPQCATIISTRKPSRAPQDSYCRTLGACQETDIDGRNHGTEYLSQGLSSYPVVLAPQGRENIWIHRSPWAMQVSSHQQERPPQCARGGLDLRMAYIEAGHLQAAWDNGIKCQSSTSGKTKRHLLLPSVQPKMSTNKLGM